eukprot:CAMPEP_0206587990 /NCGR_PEP_ID=MMETSP0325_2-20121206/37997_1 /ASSEMBLY_ACC=CAM_ASM_000347 /TAXON_ID=2866 /ORGANISM="Crypthecodinium cohnii, Strain Seligo" /LENGTH=240 /DNA_ID=CAMNT_0054096145 /DNA_START=69 /DNA_END=788 /DNA_ORIENTATION=-
MSSGFNPPTGNPPPVPTEANDANPTLKGTLVHSESTALRVDYAFGIIEEASTGEKYYFASSKHVAKGAFWAGWRQGQALEFRAFPTEESCRWAYNVRKPPLSVAAHRRSSIGLQKVPLFAPAPVATPEAVQASGPAAATATATPATAAAPPSAPAVPPVADHASEAPPPAPAAAPAAGSGSGSGSAATTATPADASSASGVATTAAPEAGEVPPPKEAEDELCGPGAGAGAGTAAAAAAA